MPSPAYRLPVLEADRVFGMGDIYTAADWVAAVLIAVALMLVGLAHREIRVARVMLGVGAGLTVIRWIMWSLTTDVPWPYRAVVGGIIGAALLGGLPSLWAWALDREAASRAIEQQVSIQQPIRQMARPVFVNPQFHPEKSDKPKPDYLFTYSVLNQSSLAIIDDNFYWYVRWTPIPLNTDEINLEVQRVLNEVLPKKVPPEANQLQPGSLVNFVSPRIDYDFAQAILAGKSYVYLFFAYKYLDDNVRPGKARLAEICLWVTGDMQSYQSCPGHNRIYEVEN